MLRYLFLTLLLATAARADHVVVNQDGSATATIQLTAEEYLLAQIAHAAQAFEDPTNTPSDIGELFVVWLKDRINQWVERAREVRRQRAAPLTPAQELAATQAALSP